MRRAAALSALLAAAGLGACAGGELEGAPPAAAGAAGAGGSGAAGAAGTSGDGCDRAEPEVPKPVAHTPRWAFEPWISKDISSTDDTYAFVDGFESRGIPVGVVVLDSPWETNYNTFEPSPTRYHDFDKLVADLKAKGVRVVLWMTPLVNTNSFDFESGGDAYPDEAPNYAEGERCGYYVNDGERYAWWKGRGAAIDFYDPRARAWWHQQQERVLAAGVAGFKLDFGDSYVRDDQLTTKAGVVPHQEWSERYYEDFLAYGQHRVGKEDFLTMVRAWDRSYDFSGRFFARREHAPVAWMGDNRRDFVGLRDALFSMHKSAVAGYVVLGSDVGGYLDLDDVDRSAVPPNTEAFLRWTALGALTPFFQLHGRANLAPWTVPDHEDEAVEAWRRWGTIHKELVPFFYSLSEAGHDLHISITRPVATTDAAWEAGDYRYHLGEAMLVAPITEAGGVVDVVLPAGAKYWDFHRLADPPLEGGVTLAGYRLDAWADQPVFYREGAIVPMEVSSTLTGWGDAGSAGSRTLLTFPGAKTTRFAEFDDDGGTTIYLSGRDATSASLSISRSLRPLIAWIRVDEGATSATLDGVALPKLAAPDTGASEGFAYDAARKLAWVKIPASTAQRVVTVSVP